eukprot:5593882-Karenia_brevis.AAC.1
MYVGPKNTLGLRTGPDIDIINKCHTACEKANLEVSSSKAFGGAILDSEGNLPGDCIFQAWGTEVRSDPGT